MNLFNPKWKHSNPIKRKDAVEKLDSLKYQDLLAAISAAILSTGEQAVSMNEHGEMLEVIIRGEKGFTILTNAGEYIIIGSSLELNSMGLTIRVLRKYAVKIQQVICGDCEEIGPISLD